MLDGGAERASIFRANLAVARRVWGPQWEEDLAPGNFFFFKSFSVLYIII